MVSDGNGEDSPLAGNGELATRLEELVAERDGIKDQLLRTAADFDNFRKRVDRELEAAERRGREETLLALLPIVDNLERAAASAAEAVDVKATAEGVQLILDRFRDISAKLGLERVSSLGQPFDPNFHQAVQQLETAEHAPGTVMTELTPGYRLGDRVFRAAVVVVAKAPS